MRTSIVFWQKPMPNFKLELDNYKNEKRILFRTYDIPKLCDKRTDINSK